MTDKDALTALITERQSVRAFLNKKVEKPILRAVLSAARYAPSGVNTQPWQVAVIGPQSRKLIYDQIITGKEAEQADCPDYAYYPTQWESPYLARRKACGLALYGALGIEKTNTTQRKAQWYKNYDFFGASAALVVLIPAHLEKGSWLDTGMFIQSLLLAARAHGLETCAEASMAERPDIIRTVLGLPDSLSVVCGVAIGYADWDNPVNQYRTAREPIDSFTTWHD